MHRVHVNTELTSPVNHYVRKLCGWSVNHLAEIRNEKDLGSKHL